MFGEATDKLIEELFRANLQMKRVSAVLDADIQQLLRGEQDDRRLGMSNSTVRARRETLGLRLLT